MCDAKRSGCGPGESDWCVTEGDGRYLCPNHAVAVDELERQALEQAQRIATGKYRIAELERQVRVLREALRHVMYCSTCWDDWNECAKGKLALAALAETEPKGDA